MWEWMALASMVTIELYLLIVLVKMNRERRDHYRKRVRELESLWSPQDDPGRTDDSQVGS
jgi:hypothetical protein